MGERRKARPGGCGVKRRGLADPQARAMGRLSMAGSGERAAQRREKETDRTSLAERETGEEDR